MTSAASATVEDRGYPWRVLVVVMVGTVMSALDASIVNVSLPAIMATFGAGVDDIEWVITGYMLGFATFMPLTAWLRDRIGARALFLSALVVFTAGSVACGLAWSLPALVLARVVQAVGGGAITPTGMAMISEVFAPSERGRALGWWGVGVIVGPAIGPTLGGYLTQTLGWRSIFLVNLPIGVVGSLLALRVLRPDRPHPGAVRRGFDATGFLFLSVFLVSFLLLLSKGEQKGWTSAFAVTAAIVAALGFVAFLVNETVVPDQIVDLSLFRNRVFASAALVTVVRSIALYGGTFLLPLFLQRVMGLEETDTGLLMLPGAVVIGVFMPISGRVADRAGARLPVVLGLVFTAAFMFLYRRLDPDTSTWGVIGPTLVRGVGLGLLVTPVTTAAMNAVDRPEVGMASSMLNLLQQVGGSVGIAVFGFLLAERSRFHLDLVASSLDPRSPAFAQASAELAQRALRLGLSPSAAHAAAGALVGRHAAMLAQTAAFDDSFLVGGVVVALGILPALLLPSIVRRTGGPVLDAH